MLVVIIILFITDVRLAGITLAVVPILFGLGIGIRLFSRRTSKNWRKTIAILNANVAESISGIEVTKSFNQEKEAFGLSFAAPEEGRASLEETENAGHPAG